MDNPLEIRLSRYFRAFIEDQIQFRKYDTVDEVICDGLRLLEERESRRDALEAALIRGKESGEATDFNFETWREERLNASERGEAA